LNNSTPRFGTNRIVVFLRLGISACMLLRNQRLLKDFGQGVVVVGMLLKGLSHEIFTGCFGLNGFI
jgi:hypothetical protein